MEFLNSTVSNIVLCIIIVIIGIKTILDQLESMGLLSKKLSSKLYNENYRKKVNIIIDELGLSSKKDQISYLSHELFNEVSLMNISEANKTIDFYIKESIEKGDFCIHSHSKNAVEYFLNLRKKLYINESLENISNAFASYIYDECKSNAIYYNAIAVPSTSSLVLNYWVSALLKKQLIVFDIKTDTKIDGKKWNLVGGNVGEINEKNVIIIDESFVNGGEINNVLSSLDECNIKCKHVFAIFSRKEGSYDHYPSLSDRVEFHVMRKFNDEDLKAIYKKAS